MSLTGTVESGTVQDDVNGDFERFARSFGGVYARDENLSMRARIEYRDETGDGLARDRETWALTTGFSNQVARDWRLLANVDALVSDSAESNFRDGEYVRASLGYAYRPIDNERFNMLLGLTHLRDLPGEDQVAANGSTNAPYQISDVFTVAANYDLNEHFTLGGKIGYRSSQVATRGTDDFVGTEALLTALRVDWHVANVWDVMAEGRALFDPENDTTETGAVVGVYRQMNQNLSVGVAHEWGAVSDDMTDIDYDGQGVLLNIVGKF